MNESNERSASRVKRIHDIQTRLAPIPEAQGWSAETQLLARRLEQREKLVAVFGAYSAGKSSLLNALLGQNVLAVSPNPTTAAVSQISLGNPLDGADVTAKNDSELWEDVSRAFDVLHQPVKDLDDAMEQASKLKMAGLSPSGRRAASFLKAAANGYPEMKEKLSTSWHIAAEQVRQFTAEERYACYLQRVDVYHTAPVLKSGMVLVDTPGVDSIHRRHTDVAFDYMRKADAIVFVLYYTHAFSRADKDFLAQLAGVQDVVGTDKLFVVINAVDLATSDEEREAVRDRVQAELRQAGIRRPRVFEVSSQIAWATRQLQAEPDNPQMTALIRQRLHLAEQDPLPPLQELATWAGVENLEEALSAYLNEQEDRIQEDAVLRFEHSLAERVNAAYRARKLRAEMDAQHLADIQRKQAAFQEDIRRYQEELQTGAFEPLRGLQAEWEELIFHAGERIRFRLQTLFREAFYPGRFRNEGSAKTALGEAAEDLANMLVRQVEMESRTFALRAEVQVSQAVVRWLTTQNDRAEAVMLEPLQVPNPEAQNGVLSNQPYRAVLDTDVIRRGFKHFHSSKQFFEGDGQKQMFDALEADLTDAVRSSLQHLVEGIRNQATSLYQQLATDAMQSWSSGSASTDEATQSSNLTQWEHLVAWAKSRLS